LRRDVLHSEKRGSRDPITDPQTESPRKRNEKCDREPACQAELEIGKAVFVGSARNNLETLFDAVGPEWLLAVRWADVLEEKLEGI
jgi:hypothetical protein